MARVALLVEDDEEQIPFTSQVLSARGYEVTVCRTAGDARLAVPEIARPVDLAVVDRRLPEGETDEPSDDVGDSLLDWLLGALPDTPFVVFTGFGDMPHLRFATQERGVIPVGDGGLTLDRVVHLDKGQTIEFEKYVHRVAETVDQIGDVDLVLDAPADVLRPDRVSARLLRRVAQHFRGSAITARPLRGGLTGASIWQCDVRGEGGVSLANVVVKEVKCPRPSRAGGLHSVLPAARVAAPIALVTGLCDARRAMVMQVACAAPESMTQVIAEDEERAAALVRPLIDAIRQAVPRFGVTSMRLEEVVLPFIKWTELAERLERRGIPVPRPTLQITLTIGQQHGDLHPGNIVVRDAEAVLIDFDSEVIASRLVDPLTLLLSLLFHPDSPVRSGQWPSPDACMALGHEDFFQGCTVPAWTRAVWDWVANTQTGEREFWAVVLGFAARQLEFPDVRADGLATARAEALVKAAVAVLCTD